MVTLKVIKIHKIISVANSHLCNQSIKLNMRYEFRLTSFILSISGPSFEEAGDDVDDDGLLANLSSKRAHFPPTKIQPWDKTIDKRRK